MKNNKIVVTIIYPSDPLGQKIGGAETFLKGFIKYAPADIAIELIGIASAASNYLLKTVMATFPFLCPLSTYL